jgi:diguanylate cyclase (GGDEF)-like protein
VRTRTPLAVALLDIDRFKVINDTYGHLAGDQVLKELARSLDSVLRDYDRAGRFGGEEFSLLLPQTRAVDAFRIAERVRASIAGLSIIVPGATGGERVHVTVSIGVAALDSGCKREYSELMAAADAALYRAKSGGRDQVQMISTTRGLSAISGADDSDRTDGGARGSHTDAPSVFRRAQISLSGPPTGPARTLAYAFTQRQSLKRVVRRLRKQPLTAGGRSVCQDQLPVRMALLLSRAAASKPGGHVGSQDQLPVRMMLLLLS